ncbi:unnamed protein product [Closterium sp. NIES-53]
MASRILVSGIPHCLPPLPPGPAPTCVPCVEGRQRAAPYSSSFPPTEAPLQTLHMDVWGPARVRGQGHERYFLLVVDDYSHKGGEFSSDLLRAFCRAEGIRQTFTLPASPHQNGIAERHIGMVMDVARTSMIHAATPHFLWPFAVQYAAHQINLQPRVSLPETTPTLRWTGKVGDVSAFRVWGSRAFVRDTSADKLSSHAGPCVLLGFPRDAPGWQFYHPTSRHVLSSQDVTFDESVSYYRTPPVDPFPPQGPAPSGVSQVDIAEPVEVAVDSGAARGAEPAGAGTGGAEPGVAEPERVEPGVADSGSVASWGAEPACAESRGSPGVLLQWEPPSPQRLREWYARLCRRATRAIGAGAAGPGSVRTGGTGAAGAGATRGAAGAGAAGGAAGAGATGGAAGAGAAGGASGAGAAGGAAGAGATGGAAGAGATGGAAGAGTAGRAAGAGAAGGADGAGATRGATGAGAAGGGSGAVSAVSGGATRPRPYYVLLLQQVLGLPPSPGPTPALLSPPPVQSQSPLQPSSPLPGPSPYSGPTRDLTECREPESRPMSPVSRAGSPVRTVRAGRVLRPRPPPVPGTHSMTLRPSTAPQHVPLPSPPASSLPDGPDLESDSLRAAGPTVTRFLATAVTHPLFESFVTSALVAELVDFATAYCLDYATSLVAESESASVCPPSVGGECALGTDVLEDRQEEFECFAAAVPHLVSMLLACEGDTDAPDIPTPRSYAEAIEVPPFGANTVSGMWIFGVKRPSVSLTVFKARYFARGFSQRQGVDFFLTFSPTPKMTTLRWHDTLRTTLATLGFAPSTADPSLFLRCYTTLPPFYVLVYVDDLVFATADTEALAHVLQCFGFTHSSPQSTSLPTGHSLSAPPLDESVEPSGPYPELVGCLITSGMGLVLGGRARVVLTGHADVSWVDDLIYAAVVTGLDLHSSCEAEIYTGAMAAQELRWLTYLLTDLGESPRSPPVLTKHIALRYFLARELQQRGQLRLAYVASQANTADVFTKALQPCDHQPCFAFLTGLGIHLETDSTTQEFMLYHGKGGLYIGKAVLKYNVFVLDFVPDQGTADSDAIVNFTCWTHPPDLDPDFSPRGF